MTTMTDIKLTRAEAAYAHLASFAKGDQVVVSGRGYALEGTIATPQQDARRMERAYLIVTGTGTYPDGNGGWIKTHVECVITVSRMLSGRCFTLATEADAAAGNWQHFDAATWAMRNPEPDPTELPAVDFTDGWGYREERADYSEG